MKTYTCYEAKQKMGEVFVLTQENPVAITRHGFPAVVMSSHEEFAELMKIKQTIMELADDGVDFDIEIIRQSTMMHQQADLNTLKNVI